jgi:flagellar biosynthetic protein FliO
MGGSGATTSGAYGELLATSLLVLVGVCVLAFVLVRVARRYLGAPRGAGAGMLDVVARVPLEPRRSLYVVEVAGKALLVGTSEMGLTVLSELDRDAVRARAGEVAAARTGFAELVQAAWARRRARREPAATAAAAATAPVAPAVSAAQPPPAPEPPV